MTTIKTLINDLVFENINDKYAWGNYGEFKVMIMKENGYINVTKLCKSGGKEFFSWKRLDIADKFLDDVSSALHIPKNDILITINGGNQTLLRGTYAHPSTVNYIASWISPRFAIKVSSIIDEWRALSHKNEMEYWTSMGNCILTQEKKMCIEHSIRDRLSTLLNGKIEVETEYGIADIVTDKEVIEVKRLYNWKHALGQVLSYASDPSLSDRKMRIHLFDDVQASPPEIHRIESVCCKYGCSVTFERIE
jgi:hypothetical protein